MYGTEPRNPRAISEAEVRARIAAEGVSDSLLAEIIQSMSAAPTQRILRGNARANSMALSNLSLREADMLYPHLSAYL